MTKTIDAQRIHAKRMADSPEYQTAYNALEEEFTLIASMTRGPPQSDQPETTGKKASSESEVGRLESRHTNSPSSED